jgi:hypothetical protein
VTSGQVVFSGSLEAEECLSKNGIRSIPILGGVCFGMFIGVPLKYGAFVYVTPSFTGLCPSCTETCLLIIIFAVQKKYYGVLY